MDIFVKALIWVRISSVSKRERMPAYKGRAVAFARADAAVGRVIEEWAEKITIRIGLQEVFSAISIIYGPWNAMAPDGSRRWRGRHL